MHDREGGGSWPPAAAALYPLYPPLADAVGMVTAAVGKEPQTARHLLQDPLLPSLAGHFPRSEDRLLPAPSLPSHRPSSLPLLSSPQGGHIHDKDSPCPHPTPPHHPATTPPPLPPPPPGPLAPSHATSTCRPMHRGAEPPPQSSAQPPRSATQPAGGAGVRKRRWPSDAPPASRCGSSAALGQRRAAGRPLPRRSSGTEGEGRPASRHRRGGGAFRLPAPGVDRPIRREMPPRPPPSERGDGRGERRRGSKKRAVRSRCVTTGGG